MRDMACPGTSGINNSPIADHISTLYLLGLLGRSHILFHAISNNGGEIHSPRERRQVFVFNTDNLRNRTWLLCHRVLE